MKPQSTGRGSDGGLRPRSAENFIQGIPYVFQCGHAKELDASYQFTFTGRQSCEATVEIRRGTLKVHEGHVADPDATFFADAEVWVN